MLNKKVVELLVKQVNYEFYSAYLYLNFSNYYTDEGLDGFANWYMIQAQEEKDHAILFMQYLQNNGESVELGAINKPDVKLENHIDPLKEGLSHERYVTDLVHKIYDEASQCKDYRTMQFLDWFVMEQGEEEKTAEDLVKKYQLFGKDSKGLYALNEELRVRAYSTPLLTLD